MNNKINNDNTHRFQTPEINNNVPIDDKYRSAFETLYSRSKVKPNSASTNTPNLPKTNPSEPFKLPNKSHSNFRNPEEKQLPPINTKPNYKIPQKPRPPAKDTDSPQKLGVSTSYTNLSSNSIPYFNNFLERHDPLTPENDFYKKNILTSRNEIRKVLARNNGFISEDSDAKPISPTIKSPKLSKYASKDTNFYSVSNGSSVDLDKNNSLMPGGYSSINSSPIESRNSIKSFIASGSQTPINNNISNSPRSRTQLNNLQKVIGKNLDSPSTESKSQSNLSKTFSNTQKSTTDHEENNHFESNKTYTISNYTTDSLTALTHALKEVILKQPPTEINDDLDEFSNESFDSYNPDPTLPSSGKSNSANPVDKKDDPAYLYNLMNEKIKKRPVLPESAFSNRIYKELPSVPKKNQNLNEKIIGHQWIDDILLKARSVSNIDENSKEPILSKLPIIENYIQHEAIFNETSMKPTSNQTILQLNNHLNDLSFNKNNPDLSLSLNSSIQTDGFSKTSLIKNSISNPGSSVDVLNQIDTIFNDNTSNGNTYTGYVPRVSDGIRRSRTWSKNFGPYQTFTESLDSTVPHLKGAKNNIYLPNPIPSNSAGNFDLFEKNYTSPTIIPKTNDKSTKRWSNNVVVRVRDPAGPLRQNMLNNINYELENSKSDSKNNILKSNLEGSSNYQNDTQVSTTNKNTVTSKILQVETTKLLKSQSQAHHSPFSDTISPARVGLLKALSRRQSIRLAPNLGKILLAEVQIRTGKSPNSTVTNDINSQVKEGLSIAMHLKDTDDLTKLSQIPKTKEISYDQIIKASSRSVENSRVQSVKIFTALKPRTKKDLINLVNDKGGLIYTPNNDPVVISSIEDHDVSEEYLQDFINSGKDFYYPNSNRSFSIGSKSKVSIISEMSPKNNIKSIDGKSFYHDLEHQTIELPPPVPLRVRRKSVIEDSDPILLVFESYSNSVPELDKNSESKNLHHPSSSLRSISRLTNKIAAIEAIIHFRDLDKKNSLPGTKNPYFLGNSESGSKNIWHLDSPFPKAVGTKSNPHTITGSEADLNLARYSDLRDSNNKFGFKNDKLNDGYKLPNNYLQESINLEIKKEALDIVMLDYELDDKREEEEKTYNNRIKRRIHLSKNNNPSRSNKNPAEVQNSQLRKPNDIRNKPANLSITDSNFHANSSSHVSVLKYSELNASSPNKVVTPNSDDEREMKILEERKRWRTAKRKSIVGAESIQSASIGDYYNIFNLKNAVSHISNIQGVNSRRLLLHGPAYKVLSALNAQTDTYLFLFSDILVVTRSIYIQDTNSSFGKTQNSTITSRSSINFNDLPRGYVFSVMMIIPLSKHATSFTVTRNTTFSKDDQINERAEKRLARADQVLRKARKKFSSNPVEAVVYMIDNKIITPSSEKLADFLIRCTEISRRQLGKFLGSGLLARQLDNNATREEVMKESQYYMNVWQIYIERHNVVGVPIDEALRQVLVGLRLPNDPIAINTMLDAFAIHWFNKNQPVADMYATLDNDRRNRLIGYSAIHSDKHEEYSEKDQKIRGNKKKQYEISNEKNYQRVRNGLAKKRKSLEDILKGTTVLSPTQSALSDNINRSSYIWVPGIADVAVRLTFAIMTLNAELHNPLVRDEISPEMAFHDLVNKFRINLAPDSPIPSHAIPFSVDSKQRSLSSFNVSPAALTVLSTFDNQARKDSYLRKKEATNTILYTEVPVIELLAIWERALSSKLEQASDAKRIDPIIDWDWVDGRSHCSKGVSNNGSKDSKSSTIDCQLNPILDLNTEIAEKLLHSLPVSDSDLASKYDYMNDTYSDPGFKNGLLFNSSTDRLPAKMNVSSPVLLRVSITLPKPDPNYYIVVRVVGKSISPQIQNESYGIHDPSGNINNTRKGSNHGQIGGDHMGTYGLGNSSSINTSMPNDHQNWGNVPNSGVGQGGKPKYGFNTAGTALDITINDNTNPFSPITILPTPVLRFNNSSVAKFFIVPQAVGQITLQFMAYGSHSRYYSPLPSRSLIVEGGFMLHTLQVTWLKPSNEQTENLATSGLPTSNVQGGSLINNNGNNVPSSAPPETSVYPNQISSTSYMGAESGDPNSMLSEKHTTKARYMFGATSRESKILWATVLNRALENSGNNAASDLFFLGEDKNHLKGKQRAPLSATGLGNISLNPELNESLSNNQDPVVDYSEVSLASERADRIYKALVRNQKSLKKQLVPQTPGSHWNVLSGEQLVESVLKTE
ncbi:hypothetical protein BB558_001154 [Smittium angustum]|uniref:SEC7 domain-containing protein n=1 Tax=Smittium angustum TaxID=133377 RepID=A0A2U1JCD6_SMIAN|nr:hypothetical protein BB558_001154 [Smittium angustum]